LLLEIAFIGLWPVSYDLTHGADFSHEYLLQYEQVWNVFRPVFETFDRLHPDASTSLEQLTALLTMFWIASFAIYLVAFVLLRLLPSGILTVGLVVLFTIVFQVTFCLMPGTFTTDLFSYAMYGYIPSVYELNPYLYVPGFFPDNRMTSWIHPVWYYTPSIYGPLWIDFSSWLTGFTKDRSLVDQALVYRVVSNLAHVLSLAVFGLLVRKMAPPKPASMLLLFAWNPLLLFEFAGSGHNDSAMMLFVLLACLLLAYRQPISGGLSIVALSAASLIKLTPVMLLPLLLVHWAERSRGWLTRIGAVVLGGLVFVGLGVAFYLPWYSGPETFQLLDYWTKSPMYMNYVPDVIATAIADNVLDPERLDQAAAWETTRTWTKWLTRLIFAAYFGVELFRVWRMADLLAAMSRVLLVFLLLVQTWVLPWYLTWPFILALPLGWERSLTRVTTAFTFSAPLMMYNHHYWSIHMAPWLYVVYLSPLLLLAIPSLKSQVSSLKSRISSEQSSIPIAGDSL
jgi:hypothetical protein